MPIYLDKQEVSDAFTVAKEEARYFFEPFDEYERIAANHLKNNLAANMPKVNDGSLAALLLETPMRVLAQLQTGSVKCLDRDEPWLHEMVNIIWNNEITKKATMQAPFFTKLQIALYRSLIYGAQPAFSFFANRNGYRGADFILPYVRDVFLEPGKVSDGDSDYIFMQTWYTQLQIKNIIETTKEEERLAKKEKRESNSPWDVKALEAVLNGQMEEKDAKETTLAERDKKGRKEGYKLVTCFQRGVEAPFYTFTPANKDTKSQIVRTSHNVDPTGNMPINFLYAFEDLTNPYGKGQVEISGGVQNTLDYMTQLHVLGTQIGLQPPVKVRGNRTEINLESIVYGPRAFWFTGNADVEVVKTSSDIYSQFPNTYGLYKTQLMNLQGTSDASVSSESGNPQYSKTPAGVELQQQRTSAHDNFLRQRTNEFFGKVSTSMVNIHLANMQGSDVLQLLEEQAEKLMAAGLIDEDPQTATPSVQEIVVNWEDMRGSYEFEVDPDSSIAKDDEKSKSQMMEVITLASDPNAKLALDESGYEFNLGEAYKQFIMNIGIKDWEKILHKLTPEEVQQKEMAQQQMMQQQAMLQAGAQGPAQPGAEQQPQLPLEAPPEQPPMEQPVDPQAEEMAAIMEQYGLDEAGAAAFMQARAEGFGDEEILQFLSQGALA